MAVGNLREERPADTSESADESMCSHVFIVEEPTTHEESVTSSKVAEYLEQAQKEDSNSDFNFPPGRLRRINFPPTSPLNDLEGERNYPGTSVPNAAEVIF